MSETQEFLRAVLFFAIAAFFFLSGSLCERERNGNATAVQPHENDTIICENGLRYKIKNNVVLLNNVLTKNNTVSPVLNSDGTQAKCDTIY